MAWPGNPGTVSTSPVTTAVKGGSGLEGFMAMALPGIAQGLGSGLAGMAGGAGGPAVSASDHNRVEPVFDQSGWNLIIGTDNKIDSKRSQERSELPTLGGSANTTMILWLAGGVIVWKLLTRKKQ